MREPQKIEFSIRNILIIAGVIGLAILAWKLKVIIFMFFIAFILSSAISPFVDALKRRGVPKGLSIFIIYSLVFFVIGLVIYVTATAIGDQISTLSDNFNHILTETIIKVLERFPRLQEILFDVGENETLREVVKQEVDEFITRLPSLVSTSNLFGAAGGAAINIINNTIAVIFGIFTVIILSVYMTVKEDKFYAGLVQLIPEKNGKKVMSVIEKVETKLGSWVGGQISLMVIVGVLTYIGLSIPGLFFEGNVISEYALPLALIAGLLEAVPNVGPSLTWLVGIVITLGSNGSPVEVIYVGVLFFIIQQLEAILIVPAVMKKAIGIDPIVTIIALIAAFSLFNVLGALLVLPILATAQIIFEEVYHPLKSGKV